MRVREASVTSGEGGLECVDCAVQRCQPVNDSPAHVGTQASRYVAWDVVC